MGDNGVMFRLFQQFAEPTFVTVCVPVALAVFIGLILIASTRKKG